ncbi:MAG: HD domain-containing protein [Verrucomicrobiae bacterium]|nr:HD domain-containing protein [Verrucomicrobiae bacterium]
MDALSIRELRQEAGPQADMFLIHAQLESLHQKTTKTNKPYYELKFVDAEDSLVLRAWDNSDAFADCATAKARGFYAVEGAFYLNAERNSLDARDFSLKPLSPDAIDTLLAGSGELRKRQARDYADIVRMVGEIRDPRLRGLGQHFLDQYGERMQRTGAARRNHHARRGGLVEHVAQMMRTAVQICVAYPMLNRDLLVSGVLFHDIGKLWENAYAAKGFTMPYTEASELISHIPVGMEIVNRLWRDLLETPEASGWQTLEPSSDRVRLHLLHLIASHHGTLEFGSPVVPKTPEAHALHYIDNLDAKLQMMFEAYEKTTELGKNVYEKVWPLPGNLVQPLERFESDFEPEVVEPVYESEEEDLSVTADNVVSFDTGGEDGEPSDGLPIPEPDFGDEPLPDFESDEEDADEEEPF